MMGKYHFYVGSIFFVISLIIFAASKAHSSGFAIYTQGASSLGQGAATIAHSDDPSAIFFNPALINKLEATQIQLGTTLLFPKRKFEGISGESFKTRSDMFYPSTFYITHKFNDKVSAGIGVFNPFGLATEWPDDWVGRYITTKAEMTTYNINPVVSLQLTPEISVAAGLNFLMLDATLEKKINLSILDGNQKFKGDGNGVGYNLGILIEPHKDISIGASYRSKIHVDIDGRVIHKNIPDAVSNLFPNTKGKTDITLPAQAHLGICYKGFNPLTLEVAMRWEGWSSYDRLRIKFTNPILSQSQLDDPKNWKDTYSANIGAKYQLNDSIALLAGYLYSGNPVPDKTFEPSIPDANAHLYTLGTSIKHRKFKFDLAYGYQKLEDRKKDNIIGDPLNLLNSQARANGQYKSHLHMIGVSLTYVF